MQEVDVDAINERVVRCVSNWMTIPRPEGLAVSLDDQRGSGGLDDD